jgi:trehalose/maltose hydrolase-like predicted phosphorylase
MTNWTLAYDEFVPEEEGLREALTSTGNGYFCTRGALTWAEADGTSYPGTYVHGGFNRETTIMAGVPVLNEDLVNLPNWLLLELRIEGEEAVSMDNVELLSYRHEYDARYAVVKRSTRFRDRAGRETTLETKRFVSMSDMHQAALQYTITPENWSGRVDVISSLDGRVTNRGVARYRQLEGRHLDPVSPRTFGPEIIALEIRTRQSHIYVAEAARTLVYGEGPDPTVERSLYQMQDYIHQVLSFEVQQRKPVYVEKMVAFYTSRDAAINEPLANAGKAVSRYRTYDEAFERHARAWDELWKICDVQVPNDDRVQLLLRLHISHILQVCSPHTADLDAGVPARGLNGEAYRGHIFWDELFIYPFLNFRIPEITRSLLMYRYRRMEEARAAAREEGHQGAMFPWQSGSDGQEETQKVHVNPKSGKWEPDLSHNQRHISADIFYNVWRYYETTGDTEFLFDYGAEMMLDIARFWASIAHYNPDRERYEIHGVMGPDEFHEKYHDSEEEGLRNNAYTNVMVAWLCGIALDVLELLPERRLEALRAGIGLTDAEVEKWGEMSRKMFVPFHRDPDAGDGLVSQFEGYENLDELDWDHYRKEYGNIQRLDRILRAEGDDPDKYKLTKQADAVLIFFLFPEDEIKGIFERLGYDYDPGMVKKNTEYYDERTSHGSTLSFIAHAGILADIDPESSWERYMVALESDVGDVQGGTTQEGIHMGVMAGTLDLIQRGYLGTDISDGALHFDPKPVGNLDGLSFPMRFRGTLLQIGLEGNMLTVAAAPDGDPVEVRVGDAAQTIKAGQSHSFRFRGAEEADDGAESG